MSLDVTGLGQISARAQLVAQLGGLTTSKQIEAFPETVSVSCSEAVILGLLRQGVRKFLAIFGHGSTDLGEALRIYAEAGAVEVFNFRNEVEMAHVGTALSWAFSEPCAVVTSIGPGALQAMAGSLAAASNGVGLYHIYGDETTWGEGYNMQQIPKPQQGLYGQMTALMGRSYVLHTPEALREAMRQGNQTVFHPVKAGPFYLLLPINTQPQPIKSLHIRTLPGRLQPTPAMVARQDAIVQAQETMRSAERVVFKLGGGARKFGPAIQKLAESVGAAVVLSPGVTGVLPDQHAQNMHVGGSKGSISGNFAMSEADVLVAIGTRAVCQSDCSGIGYPKVRAVININGDMEDAHHYNHSLALCGDIGAVVGQLLQGLKPSDLVAKKKWLEDCLQKKKEWKAFLSARQSQPPIFDAAWNQAVLTQPVAIKAVCDFAKEFGAVKFFDAGDVQANGFQTVEDDLVGETFTDSGASYMGFASSAITAAGLAEKPKYAVAFCGDGSFMMNPQVLISAVEHGAQGLVVVFDNRRMAAITGLQKAQYNEEFKTNDSVVVDYRAMAASVKGVQALFGGTTLTSLKDALSQARQYKGLSVVHVPVYSGEQPEGGLGAYGSWNVGNWCEQVQSQYQETTI
jgi:3D-(3,5/4)-trihydroxycyclohexane-1,2-dione acylhydrolase (decyclizing)